MHFSWLPQVKPLDYKTPSLLHWYAAGIEGKAKQRLQPVCAEAHLPQRNQPTHFLQFHHLSIFWHHFLLCVKQGHPTESRVPLFRALECHVPFLHKCTDMMFWVETWRRDVKHRRLSFSLPKAHSTTFLAPESLISKIGFRLSTREPYGFISHCLNGYAATATMSGGTATPLIVNVRLPGTNTPLSMVSQRWLLKHMRVMKPPTPTYAYIWESTQVVYHTLHHHGVKERLVSVSIKAPWWGDDQDQDAVQCPNALGETELCEPIHYLQVA